jgi:hypothetical protein
MKHIVMIMRRNFCMKPVTVLDQELINLMVYLFKPCCVFFTICFKLHIISFIIGLSTDKKKFMNKRKKMFCWIF